MNREHLANIDKHGFYFVPKDVKAIDKISVFTEENEDLGEYSLSDIVQLRVVRFGLICHFISLGESLSSVALGTGWRFTPSEFLRISASSERFKAMFEKAKEIRLVFLEERLIESRDEPEVFKNLLQIIKGLQAKKEEEVDEGEGPKHLHFHWTDLDAYKKKFTEDGKVRPKKT